MKRCAISVRFFAEAVLGDLHRIFIPILMIGTLGGAVGFVYLGLLRVLSNVLGPDHSTPWIHLGILSAIGLVVGLIKRYVSNAGEMELLVDNIHVLGGHDDLSGALKSLVPVSLLCIAAGGAAGPEAPLVQTTGTLGSWLANRWKLAIDDKRVLTITGMAAGFTVLFGAPFGAAIFALEILHRRGLEYYEALLPAVLGSLCGYAVYMVATGLGLTPVWSFPPLVPLRTSDFAWSLAAGVVGALVAVLFTYLTVGLRRVFGKLPTVPRAVLGGLILGGLAFVSPFALTYGETQVGTIAAGKAVVVVLLVAAAAKLLGTSVTISTGWRGGFIIPLFFVGACLGRLGHAILPQTHEAMLMAALMVAINTGVTKTPFGSTLVVTEMAGLPLLPVTVLAAVVALLLTSEVGLIQTQRQRASAAAQPALPAIQPEGGYAGFDDGLRHSRQRSRS